MKRQQETPLPASAAPKAPFGRTGRQVSRIGQGTWEMEQDSAASIAALRRGLDLGLTHIDTAEIYGSGSVESLVGTAIRGRREDVFLATKVNPARATRNEMPRACEESLRRLGTEVLDLYLLHWLPPHPLEEAVAGFEDLVRQGKIRCWGVSNFDETALARLVPLAASAIACNQVMHHLGQRSIEHRVIPFCREQGIPVVGYSPFGAGRFPPESSTDRTALDEIAAEMGATPRQVALAFLLHTSEGFTIPKASRLEHVEENAAAAALQLAPAAIERLHAAFPLGAYTGGVPTW